MKVLIADDHWVVRESLKQVIRRLDKDHKAFEASTFAEALELLRRNPEIDLILADLVMPGFDDFEGLSQIRSEFPEVAVAVVSVHEDRDHVLRAVESGVIGYIPKSASGAEIERALERLLAGEVYFPRRLLDGFPVRKVAGPSVRLSPHEDGLDALTTREREVVDLLGRGYSVRKIAAELELSDHTVRAHIGNLMRKLGLPDRSAAIHFAVNFVNGAR